MSTDCGVQPTDVDGSTDWYVCEMNKMRVEGQARTDEYLSTRQPEFNLQDSYNHTNNMPDFVITTPGAGATNPPNFWQMLNDWVLSSWGILLLLAVVGVVLFVGYQKRKDREARVIGRSAGNHHGAANQHEDVEPHRN